VEAVKTRQEPESEHLVRGKKPGPLANGCCEHHVGSDEHAMRAPIQKAQARFGAGLAWCVGAEWSSEVADSTK
jgi:hypothetical protein